jgi:hypothetical protein
MQNLYPETIAPRTFLGAISRCGVSNVSHAVRTRTLLTRHVQNNDGGDEADTKACNQATASEETDGSGSDLHGYTDSKDARAKDDSRASANPVGDGASHESPEECTGGEDRHDKRLLISRVEPAIVGVCGG